MTQDNDRHGWKMTAGTILGGLRLLDVKEAMAMVALFVAMVAVGIIEASVVALVVPFVQSLINPESLGQLKSVQKLLDFFGIEFSHATALSLGLSLAAMVIASTLGTTIVLLASEAYAARSRDRLGKQIVGRLMQAPYSWFVTKNSAVITRQVYQDIRVWRQDFLQSQMRLIQAGILIVLPSAVAISIAPLRALIAIAVVAGVGLAVTLIIRPYLSRMVRRQKEANDKTITTLSHILNGIREVKVSNRSGFFLGKFDSYHRTSNRSQAIRQVLAATAPSVIMAVGQVGFIGTAILIVVGGLSGAEAVAQIAMIGVVVARVVPSINRASGLFNVFVSSFPYIEGLLALLDEIRDAETQFGRKSVGREIPDGWTRIRFSDVHFSYPAATIPSIRGVDLEFERGKRYGIVGPSGAGKSTLVSLLLGLLEPTGGEITVDDVPLRSIALNDWGERIGYVPQDVFLVDGTVRDNIAFGEAQNDEALIRTAIEKARLAAVVDGLPDGIDSTLGERGRRLSGGQAQRVAIARALYRKPEIIVFDEATSALDMVTELEIQQSFYELEKEILAIAVAHRVVSLRDCDAIIVMDQGHVVAIDTFDCLMETSQLFRDLASVREPKGNEAKVT